MRTALLTTALFVLGTAPALAQDAPAAESQSSESDDAPQPGFEDQALDLDASGGGTVIVGKEHLPDFTVLIDREDLSKAYDLELNERFLPKIIEAVGKEPF